MDNLVIFTDGASRGNPGNAACGFLVKGITKNPIVFFIGKSTNNFAEYLAIIKALEFLTKIDQKIKKVKVVSDSKLVINQINRKFKIKNKKLKEQFLKVEALVKKLKEKGIEVEFENKRREEKGIKLVDKELNKILDSYKKIKKEKQKKLATTE